MKVTVLFDQDNNLTTRIWETGSQNCKSTTLAIDPKSVISIPPEWTDSLTKLSIIGTVRFDAASLVDCTVLRKIHLFGVSIVNSVGLTVPTLTTVLLQRCSFDNARQSILEQYVSSCPNLEKLHIVVCGLEGTITPAISDLKHLRSLNLSGNRLSGTVPTSISTMNSLSELNLSHNLLDIDLITKTDLRTAIPEVCIYHQYNPINPTINQLKYIYV